MASHSPAGDAAGLVQDLPPIDRVRELVGSFGAYGRGHREALAMLADGTTLADVVRATAVPRRLVEQVVAALDADVLAEGDTLRIRPERAQDYRSLADTVQLAATTLDLPAGGRLRDVPGLLRDMEQIVAGAPRPKKSLDHVPATPETTVRRALWMDGTYDLAGATLLCVGDHDLTSIVTCLANPAARAVVVDVDEDLLAYIDRVATEHGLRIETAYADFRVGLPAIARGTADLVFTDPPYTPDGVRLFLTRGLQGLRDREHGRLLLAYGYGTHHPGLGFAVQQAIGDLSLVYEAILPHFNRYDGAQAVGSASDLYVCRPTARTWRSLARVTTNAVNIYTHGTQSLEAGTGTPPAEAATGSGPVQDAVLAAGRGPDGIPVAATALITRHRDGEPLAGPGTAGITELALEALFDGSAQASIKGARTSALAADLSDDPGTWLYRVLLGVTARRVAVAIPNNHPDVVSQAAQTALRDDLAGKWRLTFRRSTPDPGHAILVADDAGAAAPGRASGGRRPDDGRGPTGQDEAPRGQGHGVTAAQDPVVVARRQVLGGSSRKLGTAWRDALVKAARAAGGTLGKERARELVATAAADGGIRAATLARPLVSLPRRTVREVLAVVVGSVPGPAAPVAGGEADAPGHPSTS
ncbi:bis-aminopropyl spermidine synthase family protein [Myceligenerans indicum]|uniref:Bis-aminopropyl spermidine synthase family protein n=1 Tax=Myceligenerans indicum TaxID=2593663 RepID=A0ABS1LLS4_9MICO|nr:bis-aminopropyl spermidine synthase family protein [Myceligenerans indicum]MBL0886502.1 bis-aminopropyl spermidine synthase family protein [Myceligenerans indicum]